MEAKKTIKADLQNKRVLFFEAGMAVSLLAVILAFNWSQTKIDEPIYMGQPGGGSGPVVEQVAPTREPPKGTTRPQQKVQQNVDIIRIVLDETEIVEEIDFTEFDADAVFAEAIGGGTLGSGEGVPGGGGDIDFGGVFEVVEIMPKFQGKDVAAFVSWVNTQLDYPREALRQGIKGRVYVTFIVEKDGTLSNIETPPGTNVLLGDEAVRVVKKSPKWTPGRQRNTPVKVKVTIPVIFNIN